MSISLENIHGAPAFARRPAFGFSRMVLCLAMAHRLARPERKRANLRGRGLKPGPPVTISGRRSTEGKMSQAAIAWPNKLREMESNHFDSTVWNDFKFRDNDVVIATYGKAGTTWTQQIVGQILFDGSEDVAVNQSSLWLDLRVPPKEIKLALYEAQTHRRFLKTHLPVDALVFSPKAKYIYVGRDGRDVLWRLYNHHKNANDSWYEMLSGTPGLKGEKLQRCTLDVVSYFRRWLERDGYPFWSMWDNVRSW